MSLTRIDTVYLYTSGTNSTSDEIATKKALDDADISYTELAYNDPVQIPDVLRALSTWYWGVSKAQRAFTRFPIVTWKEYYNDLYQMDFNSVGLSEFEDSSLLLNSELVV